jgi:hypothetical protein
LAAALGLLAVAILLAGWILLNPPPEIPTEVRQGVRIGDELQISKAMSGEPRRYIPLKEVKGS